MGSIVKRLDDERIVEFSVSSDKKTCKVMELCDQCFDITLSKDEMKQLADEIYEIANKMQQ